MPLSPPKKNPLVFPPNSIYLSTTEPSTSRHQSRHHGHEAVYISYYTNKCFSIFPVMWGQPQEESKASKAHEGEMHRGTHPLREAWIVTFDPTCGGKPVRKAVLSLKKTGYQLPGKKTTWMFRDKTIICLHAWLCDCMLLFLVTTI